jgi:signal transduction histidine kinase
LRSPDPNARGTEPDAVKREDGSTALIWLVDDSALQRELTRRSLARHHDIVLFDLVGPMLERLSTGERPDLLILDWHMPEISGLEACQFIRRIADGAELPIIVLTATGHHDDLLAGLAAGANDFVRKPCHETELSARVAALVRTKRLHARLAVAESALRDEASFRERFLAILAHDLRQPLNVFALGSETLAAPTTPQHVRERVKGHFDKATARMHRMVGELLDFSRSRPQGGGMPIAPHPADLGAIIHDVVEELRLAHPAREILVDVAADGNGIWDADRLAQVVCNLLENALAHTAADSPITIVLAQTDAAVEIIVENHGKPIPPDVLTTVFDPFRRGASRAIRSRGLGLGLYIVDQIAKAHGGSVRVRSDDALTRFTVSLPSSGQPRN